MAGAQAERLSQLRVLAQQHLIEIETDKAQEQAHLSQAEADIERYSRMSSLDRKKQSSSPKPSQSEEQYSHSIQSPDMQAAHDMAVNTRRDRFRPFNEILHRLRWDPKLHIGDYVVGYLERFEGIKEMPASSWIRDFSDEEWIPMHRVRYVKRVKAPRQSAHESDEEDGRELGLVWDRDTRLDKISSQDGAGNDDLRRDDDVLSIDRSSVTGGMSL